ncbi:MAG: TraI domain-containing protein [Gammaproteobacteria bacterium]
MSELENETLPEENKINVCLSGLELLQLPKFQSYYIEIRNLVSCPDNIFRQLYVATLYNFAEFCQAMPFSKKEFNTAHGFLERQLKLVIAVLKLRRGFLFPKNAGTEQISEEEAQWTYALFSGTLLKDLHLLQSDREVTLYKADGEQTGVWLSLSGAFYRKNIYYSMKFFPKNMVFKGDILMAAFSGSICPPEAVNWLSKNLHLFKQWWNVVLHQTPEENDIEKIIRLAAKKLGITLLDQPSSTDKPDLKELFIKYLITNIKQNPENMIKTNEGMFISLLLLEDFLTENRFTSKDTLFKTLEKENWLILNDENHHHELYPKKYEDKRVLRGIIINIDALPEELQKLPIDSSYQKKSNKL